MKKVKIRVTNKINTAYGLVLVASYIKDYEKLIGKTISGKQHRYLIKDIDRSRCNSFGQYPTDKEWEERDLYILVEEIK